MIQFIDNSPWDLYEDLTIYYTFFLERNRPACGEVALSNMPNVRGAKLALVRVFIIYTFIRYLAS